MKQTSNYNLPILEAGDKYLKDYQNDAFSVIDTELKTMNDKINTLDNVDGSILETSQGLKNTNAEIIDARVGQTTLGDKIRNIDTQLDKKASKTELQTQTKRIDNFTTLPEGSTTGDAELIDGRTVNGNTYSNIGGAIRAISKGEGIQNKSIGIEKLKEKDLVTPYNKWDELTNNTDATGNWCNNYVYKKGYVKNIKLKINGTEPKRGKVYLYQYYNNGSIQVKDEFIVTGVGEVYISVNKYIEFDFMLSTKIESIGYIFKTGYTSAHTGDNTDKFKPNFEFSYVFAVGVEYAGIEQVMNRLLNKQELINFTPCNIFISKKMCKILG